MVSSLTLGLALHREVNGVALPPLYSHLLVLLSLQSVCSLHFPPLCLPGCPPIFIAYALHHTHLHPSITSFPSLHLPRRPPFSCATFHQSNPLVGSFSSPTSSTAIIFTLPSPTSSLVQMSPHFHRLCPPPHLSSPFCPFISPISSLAQMSCTAFHHSNLSVGSFHAHFLHCTCLHPSVASFPTSSLVWMSPLLPHCLVPLQSLGWNISPL